MTDARQLEVVKVKGRGHAMMTTSQVRLFLECGHHVDVAPHRKALKRYRCAICRDKRVPHFLFDRPKKKNPFTLPVRPAEHIELNLVVASNGVTFEDILGDE